jgi:hypothetical protein
MRIRLPCSGVVVGDGSNGPSSVKRVKQPCVDGHERVPAGRPWKSPFLADTSASSRHRLRVPECGESGPTSAPQRATMTPDWREHPSSWTALPERTHLTPSTSLEPASGLRS